MVPIAVKRIRYAIPPNNGRINPNMALIIFWDYKSKILKCLSSHNNSILCGRNLDCV